jgi:hypothetical protein
MEDRLPCPHCGEQIPRIAHKCKHCGEYRDASATGVVDPAAGMIMAFALGTVLVALGCVVTGISAAIVGPSAAKVRRDTNERGAITALQTIGKAEQSFFQGADPKAFAALGELAETSLLEPDLASGLQNQYVFEVGVSGSFPGERWMATATPLSPGKSGENYFAINHTGAIYFRRGQPFQLDLHRCEFPPDAHPIGLLNQFR